MGKITRWFRALLAPSPSHTAATPHPHSDSKPPKRRWNFVRSYREKEHHSPTKFGDDGTVDSNNRAIAVATAAAAVAEVAIASAQAAAAVLRMTSDGRSTVNGCSSKASTAAHVSKCGVGNREEWAAVKIQSSFRAYLSRRALKALKALVKVQALVRGNIVRRKQTVAMQRRIQALLRAQARACAERRSQFFHSPHSSSKSSSLFLHPGPATPEKLDYATIRAKSTKNHDHLLMLKRNGSKSNKTLEGLLGQQGYSYSTRTGSTDDEKSDKILEIDPGKPHYIPKQRNLFQSPHHTSLFTTSAVHQTLSSPSFEAQPFNPLDLNLHIEAANSHMRGPFTPTKSDGSRNGPNVYYDHPNYLTCTESSKAKMRSLSAPRQREGSQFERTGSTANRYSVHGELRDSCSNRQRVYGLNSDRFFASKAYPGSGSLDRLGMPVGGCDGGGAAAGFGGGHWNRY